MIKTTLYALCYALYQAYVSNESIVYPIDNSIDYEVQLMHIAHEISLLIEEYHISEELLVDCKWYNQELLEMYSKRTTLVAI